MPHVPPPQKDNHLYRKAYIHMAWHHELGRFSDVSSLRANHMVMLTCGLLRPHQQRMVGALGVSLQQKDGSWARHQYTRECMLVEKSEPDKGAPAPSHQARTSISLGSPWNTESGWKWPSEPLTRTEHLAQVLQTRGGSMLLAVRVPQDHVKPRTERCGGQRSQRGAQSEPLCCSHSRSLSCRRAGGPIRAQRLALGERAPRRQTGAVP